MPFLKIQTNQAPSKRMAESFVQSAAAEVAGMLGKPESVMMGMIETGKVMSFGGTAEPTAIAQVDGIELDTTKLEAICVFLCAEIEAKMGVPQNRVFVKFGDVPRGLWGGGGRIY